MKVKLRKSQLDWFRRKARSTDVEIYAMLFGRIEDDGTLRVSSFKYPKLDEQTHSSVTPNEDSYNQLLKEAQSKGLVFIGTIHSHPRWHAIMSRADYYGHLDDGELVSGIVEVTKDRKTRYAFWTAHCALPCTVEHY